MIEKGAIISDCNKYRYSLWRIWDKEKPIFTFVGLNPSTADHEQDDRTIRRCINFAKSWGGGGIYMANLFAYRATEPQEMMSQEDPIGPDNDAHLKQLAADGLWLQSITGVIDDEQCSKLEDDLLNRTYLT